VGQVSGASPGAERVSGIGIRMGAARKGVQGGGYTALAPILVSVPSSNTARRNVLEQPSAKGILRLVSMTGGWGGYLGSCPSSLYTAQGRA
jgi:hypothetical protein